MLFSESEHSDDQLRLGVQVPPALNYALAHNRVPLVRRLVVENLTVDELRDLEVTVELSGPQGLLAGPWVRRVPGVAGGRELRFDTFTGFTCETATFAHTDEAFPVQYRVTVAHGADTLANLVVPSEVLAHNEWFNAPAVYDLIAAFVQPNTSSVSHVLRQAAQLLERQTGTGSLDGYQSGSERVVLIAGAIYEALRAESITYVTMPASFEDTGQKVRTTAGVLAERLGNCIDLSVTYAACLEAAGLHPLIFFTPEHAFAGFFRQHSRLPEAVSLDTNHVANLVQSGMVVPVELTGVGRGSNTLDFERAVSVGLGHLHAGASGLRGMVDVHLAHRSGIKPLPSGDRPSEVAQGSGDIDDQTTPRINLPHQLAGFVPLDTDTNTDDEPAVELVDDGAPARVGQWRNSLLDLSLRNPLLKLPTRGKGLDLHTPAEALPKLDDLVHEHTPITVVAQDTISGVHKLAGIHRAQELDDAVLADELTTDHRVYGNVTEERYVTRLRTLQREARTMLQETGGNYLYLTLGALVHPSRTGEARAPLFLLPVRLEGGSGHKAYSIVADGDEIATPNYCLIEWLRVHHGLRIPELDKPVTDESGIDIVRTLAKIRQSLVENNLHYRIESSASLRLLQFSTFQMWRDLTNHWETVTSNPVVRHLVTKAGDRFEDPQDTGYVEVDESALHLPIAADGSQMKAVAMAAQGRSFVLEGPPGTGKSQTITNLIAHTIASGKKVLFVAEKQAALDVVKRRLGAIGFDHFCLDLHGRKQSLPNIRQQLKDALHHEVTPDRHGWTAAETAYRKRLETLRRHPERIHETNAAGFSAWSAYEAVLAHGVGPTAEVAPSYFSLPEEQREAVANAARELPTVLESARVRPQHPWRLSGLRSATSLESDQCRAAVDELERVRALWQRLPEPLRAAVAALQGPGELGATLEAARIATTGYRVDESATTSTLQSGWDAAFAAFHQALGQFREQHQEILTALRPEVFEHAELAGWHAEADAARRSMWRRKKKLRAVAERLQPYAHGDVRIDEQTVYQLLTDAMTVCSAATDLMQQAAAVKGLQLPPQWRPAHAHAVRTVETAHHYALVWRNLSVNQPDLARVYAALAAGLPVNDLNAIVQAWRTWLALLATTRTEFDRWTNGRAWTAAWERDGAAWTEEVHARGLTGPHRWGAVLIQLDVMEAAGLSTFARQLLDADIEAREAEEAFQRGVATAALSERLSDTNLDLFDGPAHTHEVQEYLTATRRLRANVPEWLAGKLIEQRPRVSTDKSGRDGELVRQLERKRGGLSFRELLTRHSGTITGLMPCFLMSPASVANFLEPGSVEFDLVVFDEASQIRVAEAVGAMGRARSVVVVGDSKQMPPTSVMEVNRGDDDTAENSGEDVPVPEDMDSILSECVESGLPQVWLSWHYRSSDESLIAFSNTHYYENQLASLPSPGSGPRSGVSARRVAGVFDRGTRASRTNEIEAAAIVAEIRKILADSDTRERSIGVVTFNIQQRDLLLNLLEESDDPLVQAALAREDDEALFVKNLENVQGDERDVVLFSLAFSVDRATGKLPMNFGPLLREGGQRRLNVAITRARTQVILFSSFDPADLDLSRTKSLGVRHLREYLEMAFDGSRTDGEPLPQRRAHREPVIEEIANSLRSRGYEVAPRYGLSHFTVDLAARDAGSSSWQAAVLLDSPEWSRRPTVADRDAAPELLRSVMKWPAVVRVWLPQWINDRDRVLVEIDAAIAGAREPATGAPEQTLEEEASSEAVSRTPPSALPARTDDAPASAESGQSPPQTGILNEDGDERVAVGVADSVRTLATVAEAAPDIADGDHEPVGGTPGADSGSACAVPEPQRFTPYEPTRLGSQQDLNDVDRDPGVRRLLRSAFVEVVEVEGPIERDRLVKLILERFDFGKSHSSRVQSVLRYLPPSLVVRESPLGAFVWPARLDPVRWRGFRRSAAEDGERGRKLEEVAPEEIANAMRAALLKARRNIRSTDELHKETLVRLGFVPVRGEPRLTPHRRHILQRAESIGVADGRLAEAKYDRSPKSP
ncbi:DUF4011 domain-containing protein [Allosaccharopolyspora coralli]|uniref:DUF4011 domain-containing protein n=1 Tax=Allosaccharopolyspora coralli TaxID=2665642 RepID=UPI001E35759F|nr:DUF4011 domain-containing protein [Allosaccharopolyspora coralli]